MRMLLGFVAGWTLSRLGRDRRRGADLEHAVGLAVRRAVSEHLAKTGQIGQRQFVAGVSLGVFGSAAVALVPALVGPSAAGLIALSVLALFALAAADIALRGAGMDELPYESVVLVMLAASLLLSIGSTFNLMGVGCSSCPPIGQSLLASFGYLAFALFAFGLNRFLRRVWPQPTGGVRQLAGWALNFEGCEPPT